MNKGQILSQDKKLKDSKLDLYFEGNYVLSLFDKFKCISKRIDKTNPLQVSFFLFLIGWMVPCILAMVDKVFSPWGETGAKCFSFDLSMYAFYMFSLPMLFYAEHYVPTTLSNVVKFAASNDILKISNNKLKQYIEGNNNWAKSPIIHIASLVFAYVSSIWWIWLLLSDGTNTWHGWNGALPSLPGFYVSLVSIPLGLYVIYMWILRAVVWIFFLKYITRGGIKVKPFHVDGCGGLLFFSKAIQAWGRLILAIGALVLLDCINYVIIQEASPYRRDIITKVISYLIIAPSIFFIQPFFFRPYLLKEKQDHLDILIKLGEKYADMMSKRIKEVVNKDIIKENFYSVIGYSESFENSFKKVRSMRIWPFDMATLTKYFGTIVIALIPTIITVLIE